MVPINDRPLLEYVFEWLLRNAVTHVVLLSGYKAEVIKDHFKDGSDVGLHIEYEVEERPLGRGGAFKRGFHRVPVTEQVILGLNGDNINTQPLNDFIDYHQKKRAGVTVMLTQLRSPYGIATLSASDVITGFEEKPLLPHWLNAGVYLISREVFPLFPDKGDHENSTFPLLSQQGRLFGFRSTSYWKAVDTVKDLLEASKELKELT